MTVRRSSKQLVPALNRGAADMFAPIQREFDRLVDQFGDSWANLTQFEILPRMDLRTTKDGLEITVELPGIKAEDVRIDVEDDMLTVSGEKKSEVDQDEGGYRACERAYGASRRSVTLPSSIDADKLKASMKDGVLTLSAPRSGESRTKSIAIQAG